MTTSDTGRRQGIRYEADEKPPAALAFGLALLGERAEEVPAEREVSLRLLRHIASSVHHQQYHDTDIVTVRVDAPALR